MSKIAALSAHVPVRHTPAPVRAPVAAAAPVKLAREPATARPAAPAAPLQAFASEALSALIALQAKAEPVVAKVEAADPKAQPVVAKAEEVVGRIEDVLSAFARAGDPQPTQGSDDQHGHQPPPVVAPPVVPAPVAQPPLTQPPVIQPPVSVDPQPGHGQDDEHGHKPPVQDPPPAPPAAQPAPYDPAAPQRTIAMISQRLADESIQDQARALFVAQRAAERASVIVSQGQAALAILQAMQQSYQAWQAAPAHGFSHIA